MNRKKAWTLIELSVVFSVIIIMTAVFLNVTKAFTNKNKIYFYSAFNTLEKVTGDIAERKKALIFPIEGEDKYISSVESVSLKDAYCMQVNDTINYKYTGGCEISEGNEMQKGKLELANGITYYGLAGKYILPQADSEYSIKFLMVDINGDKAPNKMGEDRLPFELYTGEYAGVIYISDCSSGLKNPYCEDDVNYREQKNLLSYDIYLNTYVGNNKKDSIVKEDISLANGICNSYGAILENYDSTRCSTLGYRLLKQCANRMTCETCDHASNICPIDDGYSSREGCLEKIKIDNPDNLSCFTLIHSPEYGMNIILRTLFAELLKD